tara:strand:- start:121 stop:504 length:384 start_codon:yes stop_codon:yes gene_type:complete
MSEIKQFRLTDGSEIICEVLEWNDDATDQIVIRNALEIIWMQRGDNRLCTYRPWLFQQIRENSISCITSGHIMAESTPTDEAVDQWKETIDYFQEKPEDESTNSLMDSDTIPDENNLIYLKPKPGIH